MRIKRDNIYDMYRKKQKKKDYVCVFIYTHTHTETERKRDSKTERDKECMSVYVCIYLLGEIYIHYWFCPRILTHTEMDAKGSSSL